MSHSFFSSRLRRPALAMRRLVAGAAGALLAIVVMAAAPGVSPAGAEEGVASPYETLPVAAVTIYPGDVIEEGMLKELHFLPGTRAMYPVVDSIPAIVGMVARRTLLPDRLIYANAIGERQVVTSGALTTAIFEIGALSMTTSVVALESGTLGQMIRVRNIDSGQVITGMVSPDGTVRVGGQ